VCAGPCAMAPPVKAMVNALKPDFDSSKYI